MDGFPQVRAAGFGLHEPFADGSSRHGLWLFGGMAFDEARSVLRRPDGTSQALRPKTEAVLLVLLRHAGRTVRRDALFDAVWPDVAVVDDSLTQCVAELRRAFADRAGVLKTLKRRGYMLDAKVGWRGA